MSTSPIALQPDLAERVRRITRSKGATVEDFVNQAVREHLEQLEEQRLEAEIQAFERMHPQLVKQYLGQFVAVHEGQMVDTDVDFETLFLRLEKYLGDVPVLIRLVSAEPTLELRAPSPRLERSTG
jgi:acetolactate synthase regulatory subunit